MCIRDRLERAAVSAQRADQRVHGVAGRRHRRRVAVPDAQAHHEHRAVAHLRATPHASVFRRARARTRTRGGKVWAEAS
eukprot:5884353-Pleurochrysis_carterae.AAC.1